VSDVAMNVGCFTEQQTADSKQQTDSRQQTRHCSVRRSKVRDSSRMGLLFRNFFLNAKKMGFWHKFR
jgi:hypothetical protein